MRKANVMKSNGFLDFYEIYWTLKTELSLKTGLSILNFMVKLVLET